MSQIVLRFTRMTKSAVKMKIFMLIIVLDELCVDVISNGPQSFIFYLKQSLE